MRKSTLSSLPSKFSEDETELQNRFERNRKLYNIPIMSIEVTLYTVEASNKPELNADEVHDESENALYESLKPVQDVSKDRQNKQDGDD